MDFSLTTMHVLLAGNTLPTTGSTQDLTASQFGIFRPDNTPATSGNAAAAAYIYTAQGRPLYEKGLGTKKSDFIYKNRVISYYKTTGSAARNNEIIEFSNFTAGCDEQVSITLRLFSKYIEMVYYNGLTRSVTITTPCCDCGEDPCATVDESALVDQFVAAINANTALSPFVLAEHMGTGSTSRLRVTGKTLADYGPSLSNNPSAFNYEFDRLTFRGYAYKGPENTQDYITSERCDNFADVTILQRASFPTGLSEEIKIMEKRYRSYQSTHKDLYRNADFNHAYQGYSEVVDGTVYDTYVLKFYPSENNAWNAVSQQDERIIIAMPTTQGGTINTILQNFTGLTVTDETATGTTSTTTTSTTSTSTTSTTSTLMP